MSTPRTKARQPAAAGPSIAIAFAAAAALVLLPIAPARAAVPELTAEGAVLWEPATDTVLFDREAEVGRPMASTTKIMTVLLALEAASLHDEVSVSAEAARISATPGGATLDLLEGDRVPMRSLLPGLILQSGNGAAVAVAEHVAGDEDAFVELMNARAADLGLQDTHFVNSTGLTDDPEHRASPMDLAVLADVAMSHPDFARWAGLAEETSPAFGTLTNRNELIGALPGATGVKTGYTSLAGLCLVASATRDGRTLYAVVLGSEDSFTDAITLLEHGFGDYRRIDVGGDDVVADFRWADTSVGLVPDDPFAVTVDAGTVVTRRVVLRPVLERPVPAGGEAGEVVLLADGDELARTPLQTAEDVEVRPAEIPASEVGAAVQDALRGLVRLRPMDHAR